MKAAKRENQKVRPKQIWESCDPREGCPRRFIVEEIEGGMAVCLSLRGRRTRIRLDRFRPTSTGYRLIPQEKERA